MLVQNYLVGHQLFGRTSVGSCTWYMLVCVVQHDIIVKRERGLSAGSWHPWFDDLGDTYLPELFLLIPGTSP